MSGLVRGERLLDIRSLGVDESTVARAGNPASPMVDRVRQLEDALASARAEVVTLGDEHAKALVREFERGLADGLKERDDRDSRRLLKIEAGMATALEAWEQQLAGLDQFALEVARTVLGRMLGNPDWQAEFVARAVISRVEKLQDNARVVIGVSAADFPDGGPSVVADGKASLVTRDDLASGQCEVDLGMGTLRLGPDAQWREAARLLDRLADGDVA